jgi:hypothetical protein
MEAVKASGGSIALTALAVAIAAGMLWASVALAGGSGSSASPSGSQGSSPIAYTTDGYTAEAPQQGAAPDGDCPNMGGGPSGQQQEEGSSGTGSSL